MTQQSELQAMLNMLSKVQRLSELPIGELVLPSGMLENLARGFTRTLKPTQLRRIFHKLKQLEQEARRRTTDFQQLRTELALTLPELAYACGRGLIPKEFYDFMRALLYPPSKRFQDNEDLKRLIQVLTALLAYHKFYGGR